MHQLTAAHRTLPFNTTGQCHTSATGRIGRRAHQRPRPVQRRPGDRPVARSCETDRTDRPRDRAGTARDTGTWFTGDTGKRMKRQLITEQDVLAAAAQGRTQLAIALRAIVTPLAADTASEKRIVLVRTDAVLPIPPSSPSAAHATSAGGPAVCGHRFRPRRVCVEGRTRGVHVGDSVFGWKMPEQGIQIRVITRTLLMPWRFVWQGVGPGSGS